MELSLTLWWWTLIFFRWIDVSKGFVPSTPNTRRHRPNTVVTPPCGCCYMVIDTGQELVELAIATTVGIGSDPLVQSLYNMTHSSDDNEPTILSGFESSNDTTTFTSIDNDNDNDDDIPIQLSHKDTNLVTTLLYGAVDSIAIAARVYAVLLVVDLLQNRLLLSSQWSSSSTWSLLPISPMLDTNGHPIVVELDQVAPIVAFTVWCGLTLSTIKRLLLLQAVAGTKLRRVKLYDRLLDVLIALETSLLVLDELQLDIGRGFQSLFAAGGIGALIVGLASKDLAENIVGGLLVSSWNAFAIGDIVRLGDGTEGTIQQVGLVETEIMGYDSTVTMIPNAELTTQRVCNLSRIQKSAVRQSVTLKCNNKDTVDQLPMILEDIKHEIRSSCPKVLIVDGSKPFRAVLTQYEDDHVKALVECHFSVSPVSSDYVTLRQEVILAIARAIHKNGM